MLIKRESKLSHPLSSKIECPLLGHIHMNLFGPIRITSLGRMHYAFVIVDYYYRFIWVCFLTHKNDALMLFKALQKEF